MAAAREMSGAQTAAPGIGIPCEIRSGRVRRVLCEVFTAIQSHPRDWARLCRRVQRVGWLSETSGGTLGEWCVDRGELANLYAETHRDRRLWQTVSDVTIRRRRDYL